MAEYNCPHLCGGILFDLFLETRKPRKKVRDRQLSGTDNLSDVDVYKGFAYVITGENMQDYSGGAIRKCVSQYKCCESSKGSYVPFTDHAVRSAFVSATVTDKISVYRRLVEFKDKYLSDSKCEWLIRAIVDIIQNDCCIDAEQAFEVKADCFISKEKLNETQEVNFAVFIGSVLSYVIENCPDCESGKETFKEWYTRKNTRAEWKFCSDIGKTLKPISVDFEIRTKKKEHSATVKSDTSCEHIVEMPIEDLKDKKWIPDIAELFKNDFDSFGFTMKYCEENEGVSHKELNDALTALRSIANRQIGVIELDHSLDIDEVTEIFIRINSKGTALSQSDFVMSKMAADINHGGNTLRKVVDYFCHLAVKPDFYTQMLKDSEFSQTEYAQKLKWLSTDNEDIYDPDYNDMLRVAFMYSFHRGKLGDLVSLLSGRDFLTKEFKEEIIDESYKKMEEGMMSLKCLALVRFGRRFYPCTQ